MNIKLFILLLHATCCFSTIIYTHASSPSEKKMIHVLQTEYIPLYIANKYSSAIKQFIHKIFIYKYIRKKELYQYYIINGYTDRIHGLNKFNIHISLESPNILQTLNHEIGHIINNVVSSINPSEIKSINDRFNIFYNNNYKYCDTCLTYNKSVYVSSYAIMSFDEDFSELLSYLIINLGINNTVSRIIYMKLLEVCNLAEKYNFINCDKYMNNIDIY